MKKQLITILFILLIIIVTVGCFDDDKSYVKTEEITENPDNYYNITSEDLNNFPKLKKAINNPGKTIDITSKEHSALMDFFEEIFSNKRPYIIIYNESYYRVFVDAQT